MTYLYTWSSSAVLSLEQGLFCAELKDWGSEMKPALRGTSPNKAINICLCQKWSKPFLNQIIYLKFAKGIHNIMHLPLFHLVHFAQKEWVESKRLPGPDPQQGRSRQSRRKGRVDAWKCGKLWTQGLPTKHLQKYKKIRMTRSANSILN